jgi:hypothetical protein
MKIEQIIYDTTRELLNLEDKLRIATIFLFCEKLGTEKLSELLYGNDIENFIDNLQNEFIDFDVDFSIRLNDKNVTNAFYKTLEKYKEKNDSNGFLKAVYEKDPFAIVICNIVNHDLNLLEIYKFKRELKNIQLTLF